ncbi:transposase [Microbispora sp. ATCC PTA-5024]|nr:transposase [Microbispora sp. ATCC PTA-5024]
MSRRTCLWSTALSARWCTPNTVTNSRRHSRRACARSRVFQNADGLEAMPKSAHPGATKALAEIWNVVDKETNPIEATFATLRHGTKVTEGPGSRAARLAMAFKLIESAQARRRAVNAPHVVALVRAGARFEHERDEVGAA